MAGTGIGPQLAQGWDGRVMGREGGEEGVALLLFLSSLEHFPLQRRGFEGRLWCG